MRVIAPLNDERTAIVIDHHAANTY